MRPAKRHLCESAATCRVTGLSCISYRVQPLFSDSVCPSGCAAVLPRAYCHTCGRVAAILLIHPLTSWNPQDGASLLKYPRLEAPSATHWSRIPQAAVRNASVARCRITRLTSHRSRHRVCFQRWDYVCLCPCLFTEPSPNAGRAHGSEPPSPDSPQRIPFL